MIRFGARVSKVLRNGNKGLSISLLKPPLPPAPLTKSAAPPLSRTFSSSSANPVALEMINYATSLAREGRTEDSYARGLMILEQCETSQPDDYSKALAKLASSTLLFERGSDEEAIERLQKIQDLGLPSTAIKVAASEALAGIYLENYQDNSASMVIDKTLHLLSSTTIENNNTNDFEARVKAMKGLVELIHGNHESGAMTFFEGIEGKTPFACNAALSCGELFHGIRKFSVAKDLYQNVIDKMSGVKDFTDDQSNLGACNMIPAEVATAATCALGQLEAHMGNFTGAEETLTVALTKTEDRLGPRHPKVGVVLTCLGLMYRLKATAERSSSLLIQEGLFRRAIELLKAPQLEDDCGVGLNVQKKDIIALARGGYGDTLGVQQARKAEGERLKHWAEKVWTNRRISLTEALEVDESCTKVPVIDTRIFRIV